MNEVHRALRERRTAHEYTSAPLPEGALRRAIDAAAAAPNHRMTEPWRFRQVGPVTRNQLLELYLELKTAKSGTLTEAQRQRLQDKFMNPAELLVVSRVRDDDPAVAREDYAAVACAVQNLMLALHVEGVGTKWTTGAVTREDRTYDVVGVDFETERIEGFVWAGIAIAGDKPVRRLGREDLLVELP